jgi:5-methylthioadenosine/S-adenosylhomocysteine deaminase
MRTLIDHLEFLLTVDRDDRVLHDASVLVEDDRIVDVGSAADIAARHPRASVDRVVDGSHFGMVPGFVDSHVHLSGTLSRAPVTHTPTTEKIRA